MDAYVARVQYDGAEAGRGRMDAADLGGAIMGIADMVSGAGALVAGDDTQIRAQVRADFEGNSFVVVFEIVAFVSDLLGSVDSVVSLLGFSENSNGMIQILQWIRGRRITAVRPSVTDDPSSSLTLVIDNDSIRVSLSDMRVLRDEKIVKGFTDMIKPLREGRAARLTISNGGDSITSPGSGIVIPQQEAGFLQMPAFPDDETVTLAQQELVLTVVTPVFEGDYLWRLRWSGNIITARMEDTTFVDSIQAGRVTFGHDDTLHVQMVTDEIRRESGKTFHRHRIVKVLNHQKRDRHVVGDLFPPKRPQ